jgi:hypothetical protein
MQKKVSEDIKLLKSKLDNFKLENNVLNETTS